MRMFTPADLKLKFELNARPFWREWDRFEYLVSKAPKGAEYLDATLTILHTHGEERIHRVSELQNLFKLNPNKISRFATTYVYNHNCKGHGRRRAPVQTRRG